MKPLIFTKFGTIHRSVRVEFCRYDNFISLRDIARIPGTDIRSRAFSTAHAGWRETKMPGEAATAFTLSWSNR